MRAVMGFCLLIAGSAVAAGHPPVGDGVIDLFRSKLETTLLDARSARFKDVVFVEPGPDGGFGGTVCGLVNSKNALGAYVGYRTFVGYVGGSPKETVALVIHIDDDGSGVASEMCANYSY